MKREKQSVGKEKSAQALFLTCAVFSVVAVFAIVFFILYRSLPALEKIGIGNFLFGDTWEPRWEDKAEAGLMSYGDIFGIRNMLLTSLIVTAGAVVLGGLLGVFTAVFTTYYCPNKIPAKKWRFLQKISPVGIFEQIVNLLSGIPSIIVGFFGLTAVIPLLKLISPNGEGTGMLAAIIVLAMMITPTVASLTKNSLQSLPKDYYEGAISLGNTKDQTVFRVMLPAAKKGILSALVLGVGRAIGETMAVLFVIGGASGKTPDSFFKPVGALTTAIANELGEAAFGSVHLSALTAIGLVLLVTVLIINVLLSLLKKEGTGKGRAHQLAGVTGEREYLFRRSGLIQAALKICSFVLAFTVVFVLVYLIGYLLVRGLPHITFDFLFGTTKGSHVTLSGGIVTTLMTILLTLLIALPLGVGAAIYLNEYSKKGSKLVRVIRLFIDTLSGVPSIVFGLFGMIFFCQICGFGYSILAGSLTMVLIVLPTVIRSTEESLREVPDSMREGSFALGAGKLRTTFKVVLPYALRGVVTSVILSVGRIVGESAALIYTSGAVVGMPKGYLSQGSTLAVYMYYFQCEGLHMDEMYATAVVLLMIVLALNLAVTFVQKKLGNRDGANEKKEKKSNERSAAF